MYKNIVLLIVLILAVLYSGAQQPEFIPRQSEPIEFTPFNIILYIVLPVLLIAVFFWYRKSKSKKK
jgi:hypothetical protein